MERQGLAQHAAPAYNPFKRPGVCLCLPYEDIVYSKCVVPMLMLALRLLPQDFITTQEGAFIDTARNELTKQALETTAEYFFWIDSDNVPPEGALERLLSHKKDMVGGWYKVKKPGKKKHPCVYDYVGQDEKTRFHNYLPRLTVPENDDPDGPVCGCGEKHAQQLEKVDAMGFGCMLIHRRVFETIAKDNVRWFSTDEGGTEDMFFHRLTAKYGFDLFVDWGVHAAHYGVFGV